MSSTTRRGFLALAGAGAATAVGTTALSRTLTTDAGAGSTTGGDEALPAGAQGSLVAWVQDVQDGRLTVLVDGHETVVQDRALVAKLARLSQAATVDASRV